MTMFLRDLMDRFDQLSLRERIIVLIAALLVIAYIWDSAFMRPLDRERKGRLQQIEALRSEVSGLEQSIEALAAQGAAQPPAGDRTTAETLAARVLPLEHRCYPLALALLASGRARVAGERVTVADEVAGERLILHPLLRGER